MAGYMILHNRVTDPEQMGEYIQKVLPTMEQYKAELMVLDEQAEVLEGEAPFPRTVILKFESRDAAMAWYNSPEYKDVLPLRLESTEGFAVICESFAFPPA